MSSKFFTWTKGDRRSAAEALRSNGIVPIPAECISIKGMDYARTTRGSSKANKRPTPLLLECSPEQTSKHSSRTTDSIALHDAAVQSATNLMTVINDMLRSPPLSAHLFAQNHPDTFRPMHGRPRSRTVPSTPLVEAPMCEPVELPGSFPLERKPSVAHFSMDVNRQGYLFTQSPASASFGPSIIRPRSSPQEATHPILDGTKVSSARISPKSKLLSPSQPSPRSKSASPHRNLDMSLSNDSGEDTLVANDSNTLSLVAKRPSLSNLLDTALKSDSLPPSISNSRAESSTTVPQLDNPTQDRTTLDQADSEALLMEQISSLRASHDAHICSLKEAHEREIASHRSYISFLESRKGLPGASTGESKQPLTIDTSHAAAASGGLPTSEASATTLHSFELSLENQKRASQEASQGVEALKRKLSLCRKAQADAVDIRKERDQLREAIARSDRRILQLKDIVRKAKESEKALKNATADLEARLVLANNERMDVLEGYHEACSQIGTLSKTSKELSQELYSLRGQQSQTPAIGRDNTSDELTAAVNKIGKHDRTVSEAGAAVVKDCDALLQQVHDLRHTVACKEAHIHRLEEVVSAESNERQLAAAQTVSTQGSLVSELQNSLEEHKQMLVAAQADSERYNSLLHNELRRQSRMAAERAHSATPKIEAEAFVVATERMVRLKAQSRTSTKDGISPDCHTEPLTALLERELEHCIKEIIMYKGDLKTYKRDLKKTQAKLDSMHAMSLQRPPTPDGESAASGRSMPSPRIPRSVPLRSPQQFPAPSGTPDSGLGISLPGSHHTPTKPIAAATASALLSPTPAPKSSAPMASPSMRPKTPLGTHKKLPKPPPSPDQRPLPATPPPPSIKLQRNETLRSLSESIISSYTKREQEPYSTPPTRDRSSAPLQSLGSPSAPVSKFATPRQTPTPPAAGEY